MKRKIRTYYKETDIKKNLYFVSFFIINKRNVVVIFEDEYDRIRVLGSTSSIRELRNFKKGEYLEVLLREYENKHGNKEYFYTSASLVSDNIKNKNIIDKALKIHDFYGRKISGVRKSSNSIDNADRSFFVDTKDPESFFNRVKNSKKT